MLKKLRHSIIFRIGFMMFTISALAITSMISSFLISEMADSDAAAVNVSGSLRMQSYKIVSQIALYQIDPSEENLQKINSNISVFSNRLKSPALLNVVEKGREGIIDTAYAKVVLGWDQEITPRLNQVIQGKINYEPLVQDIHHFVDNIDNLVMLYQKEAESNLATLRGVQVVALFIILILIYAAMHSVNNHIAKPLHSLSHLARAVGKGDFTQRSVVGGKDELSLLSDTMNSMCDSISRIYGDLERRVQEKTKELKNTNESLKLLYMTSQALNENNPEDIDFQPIINQVAKLTNIRDIDLCLMTPQGSEPYDHLLTEKEKVLAQRCVDGDCNACIAEREYANKDGSNIQMKYPLIYENYNFGVLVCNLPIGQQILEWQHQLIQSLADQIALAMNLKSQEKHERRFALLAERTVIARELHDSLAQSLSYLKIQVARLQKAHNKGNDPDTTQDVIDELKEGLNSAYRQLRELLTTFRLKIEDAGVKSALEETIAQLKTRSDMAINLRCELDNIPLAADEEIHLLQIAREATQNAVYHSKGSKVNISIVPERDKYISLSIEDDGVGIPDDPEKLNHYGLAIMKERSRNLSGEVKIKRREPNGTEVSFKFLPKYAVQ